MWPGGGPLGRRGIPGTGRSRDVITVAAVTAEPGTGADQDSRNIRPAPRPRVRAAAPPCLPGDWNPRALATSGSNRQLGEAAAREALPPHLLASPHHVTSSCDGLGLGSACVFIWVFSLA
ncbi:hypothetical protein GCM10010365_70840 [Streptomyces poonensis]|uniref:Uncharacterized protein n=1 Tax=Streptomyces poonensis TaxID=68255 RepID=A0A918UWQ2_9ACTN|nr:hypothetical protein GCM10010365_70840 [Streptomyces poonensis]GLJ92900.1 hypothetical protein GCM10017589_55110 [Streptomyces poonensis]